MGLDSKVLGKKAVAVSVVDVGDEKVDGDQRKIKGYEGGGKEVACMICKHDRER